MTLRKSRPNLAWVAAESEAMWQEARDYAQQHGLQVPPWRISSERNGWRRAMWTTPPNSQYISEALNARAESS
jgi:hypothetical protein